MVGGDPDVSDPVWFAACKTIFAADSPVGKAILDKNLRYLAVNQTLADFNGVGVQAHIGRTVEEILPDAFPTLEPLLRQVLSEDGTNIQFRVSVQMPNRPDELSEWEATYLPIRLPNGAVAGVYVQAINLTAKLRAERALRDSEQQLRRVLDSLFAFVGVMTPDGTLIEANRAPLEAAGIQAADVIGRRFWDTYWWNYSSEVQQWLRDASERAAAGEVVRGDVTVRMANDSRMALDFMIVPMRNDDGEITHLIPSAIDITDRLAAQKKIELALRERTVLLQEVHHRVKNNLQIIASLLRLQARHATPAAALVLQDSQSRVMAMSLTHQLLYERNDFSSLELGPYLRRLASSLRDAHGDLLSRVRLRVEAPDVGLNIDLQHAVPTALIVNELLTNALKHGFPADRTGEVVVTAARSDTGITVQVSDDGVGLPSDFDLMSTSTLGFSLVRLLAEQLQARIAWSPEAPAGFSVELELPVRESA